MNRFLNQFESMAPLRLWLVFENYIFAVAKRVAPKHYGGCGVWEGFTVGKAGSNLYAYAVPFTTDPDGKVELEAILKGGTYRMDPVSASIAVTYIAVSWFYGEWHEAMSDATQELFANYLDNLSDAYRNCKAYDINAINGFLD